MEHKDCDSLLTAMDHCIETFAELRTPDASSVAAYDTLKQARAMIARAFAAEARAETVPVAEPAR